MSSYKSQLCKNGKNCRFAQSGRCTYAHPELGDKMPTRPVRPERPATRMQFQPDQGRKKTRLCSNYPDCKFAERCSFIHPDDAEAAPKPSNLEVRDRAMRKRANSDDVSVVSVGSSGSDESVRDATPDDFWSTEKLRETYQCTEPYIGEWYDCSVKPAYHCGPAMCCQLLQKLKHR